MKPYIMLLSVLLAGCAEAVSLQGAKRYQSSVESASYDQIKHQLSRSIDDPYSIPAFANISGATLNYNGSLSASPKRTFAPTGVTSEVALSVGSFSSSSNLTVTPVNSAKAVQVMRDLYANAVVGTPMQQADLAALTTKPPAPGWLHHSTSPARPRDCATSSKDCIALGKYGKYYLFSQDGRAYSDFALAVLQAMTFVEATVSLPSEPVKGKKPARSSRRIQSDGLITPTYNPPVLLQSQ